MSTLTLLPAVAVPLATASMPPISTTVSLLRINASMWFRGLHCFPLDTMIPETPAEVRYKM